MHNFFGGGFPGGFPGGMPGGHQRRNPNEKPEDKDVRRRRNLPLTLFSEIEHSVQ